MEIKLGKIESVKFGHCGYQDACIGLSVTLSGKSWGVQDSKSGWDKNIIPHTDHCKWSEDDRSKAYSDVVAFISDLFSQAKVSSIDKLQGIPVEVLFEGNTLKSWRILTEVI